MIDQLKYFTVGPFVLIAAIVTLLHVAFVVIKPISFRTGAFSCSITAFVGLLCGLHYLSYEAKILGLCKTTGDLDFAVELQLLKWKIYPTIWIMFFFAINVITMALGVAMSSRRSLRR